MNWSLTGPVGNTGGVLTSTGTYTEPSWQLFNDNHDYLKSKLLEKVLDGTFTVEEAKKINEHLCK
jgi:hypothetical protein